MYLTSFNINIIIYFPAKNNFMLVTPRTERYEWVQHILIEIIFVMVVFTTAYYVNISL